MAETRALKRIIKALDKIKADVTVISKDTCISDIKMCLISLREEWKEFQNLEDKLKGKFEDTNINLVEKIETSYYELRPTLIKYEQLYELTNTNQGNQTMNDLMANQSQFVHEISLLNKRDTEIRLPRINIPPFSGDYSEFPSFKDLFEASIHKNDNMPKVHKLQFLKSLLKGEAYNLIKHLNVTEANYEQAWVKVVNRYHKPKHVVYTLIKQFMDQPVLQQSSAKGLRQLTDVSDEVIRGMHVLGEEAEKRDQWLIFILVNKLDTDSREAWAHNSADQDFPSLRNFIDFLNKRSDALECITSVQRQKPSSYKRVGAMTSQVSANSVCSMCTGDHYLGRCSKYLELPNNERKELVAKKGLCFNCLSATHQSTVCRSKFLCRICKRKHHVTLHLNAEPKVTNNERKEIGTSDVKSPAESSGYVVMETKKQSVTAHQVILPTAVVLIEDAHGQMQKCRALLDSGSQSSFMSDECAARLKLTRKKTNIQITGLTSGNLTARDKSTIILRSRYNHNTKTIVEVLIIKHLPSQIPRTDIKFNNKDFLTDVELADPHFNISAPIDILIGADKFFEIIEKEQKRYESLILNQTIFGRIVAGQPCSTNSEEIETYTTYAHKDTNVDLLMEKLWDIETITYNADRLTPEQRECEKRFVDTHKREIYGRFIVKLPFKEGSGKLDNSLQVAKEYSKTKLPPIVLHIECNKRQISWMEELFEGKFSLQRIVRVVAYVLRFIKILKNSRQSITTQLTATEIRNAKIQCIIWVQRNHFTEDLQSLQHYKRVANKSCLLTLAPFIDEDGSLRIGSRLQNSDCDCDSKHPIILPQKHIFTTRVIWDTHLSKLHSGPTLTSNCIKQKYWVLNGRSRIRSILKKCVICTRYAANTTKQMMENLPPERVTPTRHFENCGIDFAGPTYITARKERGRSTLTKGYICVFVCLSVKAIHIESVTDLTSEAFLAALKRFTARRGLPKKIYTDNGSNFISARRIREQANDGYIVLTPSHFLLGTYASSVREPHIQMKSHRSSRWQNIQKRIQIFWKRYYSEYLNNIQQRHKSQNTEDNLKINDIVLITVENVPVCKWPLGRIIQVHPGSDKLIRAVTIKTASYILQRPVVKLCRLPIG